MELTTPTLNWYVIKTIRQCAERRSNWSTVKALAHHTQNCKKCSYFPCTLQLFFTTATILSTASFVYGQRFQNNFFLQNSSQISASCVRAFTWTTCITCTYDLYMHCLCWAATWRNMNHVFNLSKYKHGNDIILVQFL